MTWIKPPRVSFPRTAVVSLATSGILIGGIGAAPVFAQLPAGMDPAQVQSMLSGPISVPAGQTTSVDLGVPVSASYSGSGWSVASTGTGVTVTAPEAGGTISVPVTVGGQTATVTLVSDSNATAPGASTGGANSGSGGNPGGSGDGEGKGESGSGNDSAGGSADKDGAGGSTSSEGSGGSGGTEGSQDGSNSGANGGSNRVGSPGGVSPEENEKLPEIKGTKPKRKPGAEVPQLSTEYIELEATIEGNRITSQLGLREALDLYNRFKGLEEQGLKLRYVDAEGNIISGVKRDVDAANRTLTLTYPEGQAPDSPFIMQAVKKDSSDMALVVTLRDPNFKQATNQDGETVEVKGEQVGKNSEDKSTVDKALDQPTWLLAAAGVGIVVVLIAIMVAIVKALRRR